MEPHSQGGTQAMTQLAVVTSAAGFAGSHLAGRLLHNGWRVLGIDCFTDC